MPDDYKNFKKDHPILDKLLHSLGSIIAIIIVVVVVAVLILSRAARYPSFWM